MHFYILRYIIKKQYNSIMTNYKSAIILGMHDAIVSLTGLIAGLFFAFTDTNIIVISCVISSITSSLSMGAANYLAVKSENRAQALKSALCTGAAYMTTCVLLILPFFAPLGRAATLASIIAIAVGIIFAFNLLFYRGRGLWQHFWEMLGICTTVSIIAFIIGEFAHNLFGI